MKNWEDTVISDIKMMELGGGVSRAESDHNIAEEQAKITWDIAYKEGQKSVVEKLAKYDGSYIDKRFWSSTFYRVLLKEIE